MKIILIGFGEIGQSFVQVLERKKTSLHQRFGIRPRFVAIVDSSGAVVDSDGLDLTRILGIKRERGTISLDEKYGIPNCNADTILSTCDADIVIEATATNLTTGDPGLAHIKASLVSGRHVITVNKGPLALAFSALWELAAYNKVLLRFSGTVGGGIPILDLGKNSLYGDHLMNIQGILNGTTNYILSRMFHDNVLKETALKEAQALGYAEDDPSIDISGFDSAAKLAILANYVFERAMTIKDVDVTGINDISVEDFHQAKEKNLVIKLIATINDSEASVKPQLLPLTHPLNVDGILNAVTFSTENAGDITIIGKGAGGFETAGSIIRDLIDIHYNL